MLALHGSAMKLLQALLTHSIPVKEMPLLIAIVEKGKASLCSQKVNVNTYFHYIISYWRQKHCSLKDDHNQGPSLYV